MKVLGFICHESFDCRCTAGKLVSRRTALLHRSDAQSRAEGDGRVCFFPMPTKITSHQQLKKIRGEGESTSTSSSSERMSSASEHSDEQPHGDEKTLSVGKSTSASSGSPSSLSLSGSASEETVLSSSETVESQRSGVETELQDSSLQHADVPEVFPGFQVCHDVRFKAFMYKHAYYVGLGIKHFASDAMMTDLIKDATKGEDERVRYKSFARVKEALIRNSGIETSLHPMCPKSHRALVVNADNSVRRCEHCGDDDSHTVFNYEYICLWERLQGWISSQSMGQRVYEYFQAGLQDTFNSERNEYVDFFSGSIFKSKVEELGGQDAVRHDIFIALSGDGVQPFESSDYSYWPFVVTVLNLKPADRYKVENLLGILFVPGPKEPKDLTSFLRPFLEEIKELSKEGRMVRLWNGETRLVRVHLLFVEADLAAMKKLTHLKGHNGLVPCRFCTITGVFVSHVYFPNIILKEEAIGKRKRKRMVEACLWDIDNLPERTHEEVMENYTELESLVEECTAKELQDRLKQLGFASVYPTPLLELSTLDAFDSFPPDIMHLLFENVAKDMVDIWTNKAEKCPELAFLCNTRVFDGVSLTLDNCGSGMSSDVFRRPRGLGDRSNWKANEWKVFVLSTSLVALSGWVPEEVLNGWHLFVKLVRRVCQWKLDDNLVDEIDELAKSFYRHFTDYYYKLKPERIKLCKYVYHLLLHLASSIRKCGPISMLAQWSMENFAGQLNKATHAKNLFAQAAREKMKYQSAARLYAVKYGVRIPHLNGDENEPLSPTLYVKSNLAFLEDYELRHASHPTTIADAQEYWFSGLSRMLKRYYRCSLSISDDDATSLLEQYPNIVIWDRLYQENSALQMPVFYRRLRPERKKERRSCYFSATFQSEDIQDILVSYGKVLGFIEHTIGNDTYLLVVAEWVTKGLHIGAQDQIFCQGRQRPFVSVFIQDSGVC